MQLVEQHCIDKRDPRYAVIDETAFQSKNLYNAAMYIVRQRFIFEGKYLNYNKLDKLMQKHETYQALPRKVSQWVLKGLHHNWQSFFEPLKAYTACHHGQDETAAHQAGTHCTQERVLRGRGGV